jgi:hypothetical protein
MQPMISAKLREAKLAEKSAGFWKSVTKSEFLVAGRIDPAMFPP